MKKNLISLLFLITFISLSHSKLFNHRKVIWAVDCGNSQGYKSASGFYYQPVNI